MLTRLYREIGINAARHLPYARWRSGRGQPDWGRCIIAPPGQEEGAPLSWRPYADAVAGENSMQVSQPLTQQSHDVADDVERYEVIDGVRVEREPMGAFETV